MAKRPWRHGREPKASRTRKSRRPEDASNNPGFLADQSSRHRIAGSCAEVTGRWPIFRVASGEVEAPRGFGACERAALIASFDCASFEGGQQCRTDAAKSCI